MGANLEHCTQEKKGVVSMLQSKTVPWE